MRHPHAGWWAGLVLPLLFLLLPVSAEARCACREIVQGSSADALGEEFPETTVTSGKSEGLGEEFPEFIYVLLPWVALGEEFPERVLILSVRAALGEEFPE